jgi:hypothetical protein
MEYEVMLTRVGFFVVPCIGIFIDLYGNRITISKSETLLRIDLRLRWAIQWLSVEEESS